MFFFSMFTFMGPCVSAGRLVACKLSFCLVPTRQLLTGVIDACAICNCLDDIKSVSKLLAHITELIPMTCAERHHQGLLDQ